MDNKFIIHAVTDLYKDVKDDIINYHTHGLDKFGLTELSMIAPRNEEIPKLINIVGEMMILGETFDLDTIHCIDDEEGNVLFRFIPTNWSCFGEPSIRLNLIL